MKFKDVLYRHVNSLALYVQICKACERNEGKRKYEKEIADYIDYTVGAISEEIETRLNKGVENATTKRNKRK